MRWIAGVDDTSCGFDGSVFGENGMACWRLFFHVSSERGFVALDKIYTLRIHKSTTLELPTLVRGDDSNVLEASGILYLWAIDYRLLLVESSLWLGSHRSVHLLTTSQVYRLLSVESALRYGRVRYGRYRGVHLLAAPQEPGVLARGRRRLVFFIGPIRSWRIEEATEQPGRTAMVRLCQSI
jgi:hypothetical protein